MRRKTKRNRIYKIGSECKVLVSSTEKRLLNLLIQLQPKYKLI